MTKSLRIFSSFMTVAPGYFPRQMCDNDRTKQTYDMDPFCDHSCYYSDLKWVALSLKLRAFSFECKISIMLKFQLDKTTII